MTLRQESVRCHNMSDEGTDCSSCMIREKKVQEVIEEFSNTNGVLFIHELASSKFGGLLALSCGYDEIVRVIEP